MSRMESRSIRTAIDVESGQVIGRLASIAIAAALTAVAARIAVPLPGTPVPFTFQPVAVLLAGVLLGAAGGFGSQLLYLAAGAVGLPVFAAGGGLAYLLGPTGGFLLAFPIAAWIAGRITGWRSGAAGIALGSALGLTVIHLGGFAWLTVLSGSPFSLADSVAPFLLGDFLKIALVTVVGAGLGARLRHRLR